ncbi:MAG: hypothetical protein MK291_02410 [Planctomycetes bacterium]|nr:hypothetical protein [Planctomycetota bacterium]
MRTFLCTAFLAAFAVTAPAQNSGRKIRTQPSELAARAGSAVEWRTDLASALEEAKEEKKPLFWYVPTIHRSPMDRKVEIDRYMMAGPFSWPRVSSFVNEHFIPVRMKAGREECDTYELKPLGFVEPGWIVFDAKGKELGREHKITTFHPARFLSPLAELSKKENPAMDGLPGDAEDAATARWLTGVTHWLSQREEEARAEWTAITKEHADHPLAWKAAMELEGHGPFVHAFATYAALPAKALEPSAEGTTVLPGVYSEGDLWERSAAFLLAAQRSHGGWEDSTYDFGGTDGLPNVFVAISSVCTIGLLEHAARLDEPDPAVEAALERALGYISDESKLNREDTDEQFWAHAYLARALTRWIELRPSDRERVTPTLERATADLITTQGKDGAWAHEYANPFVTSDALIALAEAKRVGVVPEDLPQAVERGLASLLLCRTTEGAYSYGQPRRRAARASMEGSVGRTPRGELAITLWAPKDSIGLKKAVALSFEHEEHLLPAQKYDDHTSSHAYGGFFFYYDLLARTEAIAALPKGAARGRVAKDQHEQLMGLPEFDGVFMDSHEIGRAYGTGMALWCLGTLGGLD